MFCIASTRFRRQAKSVVIKSCWRLLSCILVEESKGRRRNQVVPSLQTAPSGNQSDSI